MNEPVVFLLSGVGHSCTQCPIPSQLLQAVFFGDSTIRAQVQLLDLVSLLYALSRGLTLDSALVKLGALPPCEALEDWADDGWRLSEIHG